jgi:uncharacterized membrane-anchored protein
MTLVRILIVVALQTVALAYMIIDRQATLNASRVITLKVVPVDPRDMFRGDYVVLNYDISRLETTQLGGDDKFLTSDTVYVTLENKGGAWVPVAVAHRPTATPGSVVLRGTVNFFSETSGSATLNVHYGIESYFVPEGTGLAIEDSVRNGEVSVDIAVDSQGRGMIKALRHNGKVFHVEGIL